MRQVTIFGLFCLSLIFVTQNGCAKIEPPSADNEATKEMSSESHQHEQGEVITNSIGMKLVYIPAGSFKMGRKRQHRIISKGFWMGQTELTQGQYESVMNAQPWSGKEHVREDADNPAVYVSWDDAVEFCTKLSQQEGKIYRLPSEAEWEYACRAGAMGWSPLSDSDWGSGAYGWFQATTSGAGEPYLHPVGQTKPNPWGLYDMPGNVWEWCSDCYTREDGYSVKVPSDYPEGPPSDVLRRMRGSSWLGPASSAVGLRWDASPDHRHDAVGFRVVRSQ